MYWNHDIQTLYLIIRDWPIKSILIGNVKLEDLHFVSM